MFTCPLFREFREPNKTMKLKGTNIDTILTLIDTDVENLQFLADHQTTVYCMFVYVYTSELWRNSRNKIVKPKSSDCHNYIAVKQLLPNRMLECDTDKDATSTERLNSPK